MIVWNVWLSLAFIGKLETVGYKNAVLYKKSYKIDNNIGILQPIVLN